MEIDLVTHDARKFFGLMLKRNGYVLEQLLSVDAESWRAEVPQIEAHYAKLGDTVPEAVLERMRRAQANGKEHALEEGIAIARELFEEIRGEVRGLQVSAPFGKVAFALRVFDGIPGIDAATVAIGNRAECRVAVGTDVPDEAADPVASSPSSAGLHGWCSRGDPGRGRARPRLCRHRRLVALRL